VLKGLADRDGPLTVDAARVRELRVANDQETESAAKSASDDREAAVKPSTLKSSGFPFSNLSHSSPTSFLTVSTGTRPGRL
jgi:hypothetical protein